MLSALKNYKLLIPFIGILASQSIFAQTDHWESVILPGDELRYLLPSAEMDVDWNSLHYNDELWETDRSGLGYGDNDDETVISNTVSVYLRKSFTITDLQTISEVLLHMDFDDGFVAYLNGQEIARAYVTGSPPAFDQLSDGLHEALLYQGATPEQFYINKAHLTEGENVLAVQVHNQDINSSDLSALPVLSVGVTNTLNNYRAVPEWFQAPVNFTSSNLPIIFINTDGGQAIPDEPKIGADMQIIYRGEGERTLVSDKDNEQYIDFNSKIEIEVRGSSSQTLPKKQYGFTTYDASGEDKDNVELLGMPKENDWILNGLAFDPSLMRDYISYNLSRRIGEYASRTQYCELVLNGSYNGLYILQEKMKKDDNRIDISPVGDNEDGNFTGGYITKSDKIDASDPLAWSMTNYLGGQTNFVHEEPKPDEVTSEQNSYIKNEFEKLQTVAVNGNRSKFDGYPSIIDIPSFLNFMILSELASNVDSYEFSTYFHKDKNGKLRAGPLWDFNLTFGNDLFIYNLDRSFTDVWQFDNGDNVGAKFWQDLFNDDEFNCYLSKRWDELTSEGQPLNLNEIFTLIDETELLVDEASIREQQTWNTVANHTQNIEDMKVWIEERMEWLDGQFGSFSSCANVETPPLVISKINYHPYSEQFDDISEQEFIEITNIGSTAVDLTGIYFGGTGFVYQFPANTSLPAGASLGLANDIQTFITLYGFEPFGEFTRSLSNSSEQLLLLDAFGNVIDDVTYNDDEPWPEAADGDGYFLQLNNLSADNNDPGNWSASQDPFEWPVLSIIDQKLNEVIVFPNPSSAQMKIRSEHQIKSIVLQDLQGKELIKDNVGDVIYELDLSGLSNGMYLIKIDLGDVTEIHRIIKQ